MQSIIEGAPADVFASADTANMDKLTTAGLNAAEPEIFATNLLAIIVAPGNPLGITGVADLAEPDVKTVICAAEVPCGNYANQILDHRRRRRHAGQPRAERRRRAAPRSPRARPTPASSTSPTSSPPATPPTLVEIPADINVVAEYPIATVAASANQAVDAAFIDFLLGPDGQAILADHGFGPP